MGAVADAVNIANELQLDTPIDVSISRAIADCTLTLSITIPGRSAAAVAAAPAAPLRQQVVPPPRQTQSFRPPVIAQSESAQSLSLLSPASSQLFSPPQRRLSISGLASRPRGPANQVGVQDAETEATLLYAELERLKRKALSRGIDLDSHPANSVPPEDIARLRTLFSLADSNGSGEINAGELQQLHFHMGEPLTDEEAEEAFQRINIEHTGVINFDDFLGWCVPRRRSVLRHPRHLTIQPPRTPLLPSAHARRARRRYMLAHSRQGLLSKKGEAYNQRFQKLMTGIEGVFDVNKMSVAMNGAEGTLEWRLSFHYHDDATSVVKQISPWHDIPLFALDGNVHFVTEIPQWTRHKLEIATNESLNPIKAAVKAGKPKAYSYGDMLFNYGALPQTWNVRRARADAHAAPTRQPARNAPCNRTPALS